MTGYILGIDAGTSMVKSVLFDRAGNEVAVSRQKTVVATPQPGWNEQDMDEVWQAVVKTIWGVLAEGRARPEDVVAVGITGQGDGCWLIDGAGRPVRPAILWSEGRAGELISRWQEDGTAARVYPILGNTLFPGVQGAIIRWLEAKEPETLARARWAVYCKDWIKFKMTGEVTTDETDATVPYFDIAARRYSDELLELYGISGYRHLLPPVKTALENYAPLSEEGARETGLPAGIPVVGAPFDVIASAIGVGAVNPGDACSIIGTTCFNEVTMDGPHIEPMHVGHTLCHGLPNRWMRAMGVMMGTPNLDWILEQVGRPYQEEAEVRGVDYYTVIEERIARLEPGAGGIIYHPYLSPGGERAPFVKPTARAQFFGLSMDHTRDHLVRAVYEGVGYAMVDCYENIRVEVNEVKISGGGAKSDFWCQLFADMTGYPMLVPEGSEFGAKGAALTAGVVAGIYDNLEDAARESVKVQRRFDPDREKTKRYREFYQLYRSIYQHVWDDWDLRQRLLG
ncbi:MAG TPA: carbohydrate kinase [Firmicutes bacterium]|nr:carbohydrate kinase [Bacillota bacterium]